METTTSFVMYYSYGVGKGKSKVRGAPYMNSAYERECWVVGCRGVRETKGGRGIQKFSIIAFHKNYEWNLLFILIFRDRCVIHFVVVAVFFFAKIGNIKALLNFNGLNVIAWMPENCNSLNAWKKGGYMWFSISYFRSDPKENTHSTYLPHDHLLTNWLIDWLTDYQTKLINEWLNE